MTPVADPPAVIVTAPVGAPADLVVVSHESHSDVVVGRDTPLPLIKARKTEDALLRQAIFLTSTFAVMRPAAGAGEEILRWTYEPYLQRQLCFTSITGQFSCAAVEVEELTEKSAGETPIAMTGGQTMPRPNPTGPNPSAPNSAAEGARVALVTALNTRSAALFDDDRRLKLDPMLKAAGVTIRRVILSAGRRR
jgi:hypothetical protein